MPEPANPNVVVEDGMDLDEADPDLKVELDFTGDLLGLDLFATLRVESDLGMFELRLNLVDITRDTPGWLIHNYPKVVLMGAVQAAVLQLLALRFPNPVTLWTARIFGSWFAILFPVGIDDMAHWAVAGFWPFGKDQEAYEQGNADLFYIAY